MSDPGPDSDDGRITLAFHKITNRFTLDADGKTLHRDVKIEGARLQL